MEANPVMPKRGRGRRNPDGVEGSQAAQYAGSVPFD